MEREVAFGRLLAIANVLGEKVFEKGKPSISSLYANRFDKRPMDTFTKIHSDLMEYSHKFGENEWNLFELFGEILSNMDDTQFTNEPLNGKYLHPYYSQQHSLNSVIGVEEAAKILGLSPGTVKNKCAAGELPAKKIGKTWVLDKTKLTKPS